MYITIFTLCLICLTLWFLITIDRNDLTKLKRIFSRGLKRNPLHFLILLIATSVLLTFISPLLLCAIIVIELLQRIRLWF